MQPLEVKLPSGAPLSVIFLDTEGKKMTFGREEEPASCQYHCHIVCVILLINVGWEGICLSLPWLVPKALDGGSLVPRSSSHVECNSIHARDIIKQGHKYNLPFQV